MRRLPIILLGALTLSVGLLPTTAFAGTTAPAPTPSVTAEPTPTATPTATVSPTAGPTPTGTTSPEPTATPTETASPEPTDPGEIDYLEGTFVRSPASGKAGSPIKVTSKTSCKDADGTVGNQLEMVVFSEADLTNEDGAPTVDKIIKTDDKGAWTTTVKVPASAKVGQVYYLIAACFPTGTEIDESTEPFLVYDFQEFTVTGADQAPIADPQPGDPNFTG